MTFFKHTLFAIGLLCLGILQAWATPKSNPNKPHASLVTVTWVGGTAGFETDWNTGANWSTGNVPGSSDNVLINGSLTHYPVLNNNTAIQSLTVQADASLTVNVSRMLTISGAGTSLSLSSSGTINNNGAIDITATSDALQLNGSGGFFNAGTLNVTTTGNYGIKIGGSAYLQNELSGIINSTGNSGSLFFSGNNTPVEMVKNYGRMNLTNQIEKYSDTFHNYPCGVVNLTSGEVYNNGGQIINEGFFSAPANLNGPAADFINDGIVYVSGSASYTNNKIRIFNNAASTGIFEFAGGNDLIVEGIYKDDMAIMTAGNYVQATNTFTQSPTTLGGNPVTLYAKITRPGGTCPQIVPFSTALSGFVNSLSNQTACTGNAIFSLTSTGVSTFQWQESNDAAFTSPTNLTSGGIYTISGSTLTITPNAGVDGKYYRCVGNGGVYLSNGAMLMVATGPSATINYAGSPYLNTGTAAVILAGTGGGTFSALPAGLALNSGTGAIDLAASTPGNYTVTYTLAASDPCPVFTTTASVEVRDAAGLYTWTGALSKEWNTPGNWLVEGSIPSVAPTFGSTLGNHTLIPVVVNGNYPEVSAASGARSVTIAANASLTVKSTGNLKIVGSDLDGVTNAGTFTNNGTVLIDSSYNDGFVNQTGASLINTNALTIQKGTGNRLENYGSISNSGAFIVRGGLGTAVLNFPAATITNTATFEVTGGLTGGMLNQGTVDNSAQMVFNGGLSETLFVNTETVKNRPGATMTVSGHKLLLFDNQKLLENEGNFIVRGSADRGFVNRAGATLRNKAGGVFDVNATQKTTFTNSGYIENYHTFNTSGSIDSCLYNTSTGEILNQGSWAISGSLNGFCNLGKFTHGSTASLLLNGVGGGTVGGILNAGTFLSSIGCSLSISSINLNGITNRSTGVFENNCTFTPNSIGAGPIVLNEGRYTHLNGSITTGATSDFLHNSNYAHINVPMIAGSMGKLFINSDTLILGPQASITSSAQGTPLTNTGTGYVHSQADFTISSATTLIDNAGKMILGTQSSISGVKMGTPIINTGNLTNEGSLQFTSFGGYGIDNSGTFVNKGRFETGNSDKSIHNNGGIIENSGVIEIDSVFRDAVLQEGSGSSFTNTATGRINVDFVFGNGINNTAGSFVNNGEMMIAQTDTVALSGINNAGTFQNNKLMRIGGAGKINRHGIYNTGTLTNTTDSRIILQSAEGSGITNQGGEVTNQSCAYIESTPVILNAAGTFSNAGIITKRPDNLMAVSNISTNSGSIVNEDVDDFTVTGTNSGAVVSSASIVYIGSPYVNTGTATVTLTGATGGAFSATPSGLSLNPATGEINLAASTPQSYIVTYSIAAAGGSCPAVTDTAVVQITAPNAAQIIYVNVSNLNPVQDGTTWSTAYASLSAGLSAAALQSNPVQVWVAQGTYKPGTLRRDAFSIPSGIEVYGGFAGSETQLSERNWNTHKTILSGEIGTASLSDNVNHVVLFNQTVTSTRLDGFTIERGFADYVSPNQNTELTDPSVLSSGGGIAAINKSQGLITNCVITNNKAIAGGGILLRDSSRVSVTKSIVWGNEATFGGGVYVLGGSTPELVNVLIVSNKALGGGVYINRSSPQLVNCTIASNQGTNGTAGGIFNSTASATVKNSIVWGNSSPQSTPGVAMSYSIVEGGFTGTGNLNRNPLFVSASPSGLAPLGGLGDYHLQVCSPAINAGDNVGAPLEDLEGNARPYPTGIGIADMGVYESQSTGGGLATLTVSEAITGGAVQKSGGKITATNQVTGGMVEYRGGESVTLLPGFVASGAVFQAVIGGCETAVPTNKEGVLQK